MPRDPYHYSHIFKGYSIKLVDNMRQVIASELFRSKGNLSKTMMRNLLVRGGGVQITDVLMRYGWEEEKPAATTVITLDSDSGSVRGVRYEVRGVGPTVTFRAKELWADANEKVTIKLKFDDLSKITWNSVGPIRNQSLWMDRSELQFEATHDEDGALSDEDLEDNNIGGLCVRFTILPMKVDKVFMYGGLVPVSKGELEDRVKDRDLELSSPKIPTVAMKLMFLKGKWQNALPIDLLPREEAGDKVGLGHLPLLESIGSRNPVFPEHDKVAKELSLFLRGTTGTNNMNMARLQSFLESGTFPVSVTGLINFDWPAYEEGQAENNRRESVTGWILFVAIVAESLLV